MDGLGGSGGGSRTKRERLAIELRRLRDQAGLAGRGLALKVSISQSKVSRIESGATLPSLSEVTKWAEAVGASTETRERLLDLTEAAFQELHTWRAALNTQVHIQEEILQREQQARTMRNFESAVVPGLLQTAEYARRVFTLFELPYAETDLATTLAARLQRQVVLYEERRRFDFLIAEAALRWRPGPARTLLAQLDRISSVSTLDNVSIGVIPQRAEATVLPLHGFAMYGDEEDDTFVEIETTHARMIVNSDDDVALYEKQWGLLSEMAITGDDLRDFLATLMIEIRTGAG